MLKKLVVGTVLAGCLLSCGKYADLNSKVNGAPTNLSGPGSADPASVLQGVWKTDCYLNQGNYYQRESIYQGSRFQMRLTYYKDNKCAAVIEGYDYSYAGTFNILGDSGAVEGAKEVDFTFEAPNHGTKNFTIFKIGSDGLRFGGGAFASTPATRSTTLDTGPALKKQ